MSMDQLTLSCSFCNDGCVGMGGMPGVFCAGFKCEVNKAKA